MPPGEPPVLPVGALPRHVRRLIADLADEGYEQSALARWLGTSRGKVHRVFKRNGKCRGADLIYLGPTHR